MDRRKSLEELEGGAWDDPSFTSSLAVRCHELRRTPVGDLTVADLRLLIGQQIGLHYLMSLALEVLERDPLAQGDYYRGDLLKNVLLVNSTYWQEHPAERVQLEEVLADLESLRTTLTESIMPAVAAFQENIASIERRHD